MSDEKKGQSPEKPGAEAGNGDQSKPTGKPAELSPDTAVVTINGFCDPTAIATVVKKAPAGCETVVTRQQFERLVAALDPNMAPAFRRELAVAIPRLLLFSTRAKEMGLDKDPRYAQRMKWSSLQMLANTLNVQLQKKADDISDAEIEKYYKDNPAKFQRCELLRIFIPDPRQAPFDSLSSANGQEDAADGALKAEAEKIQAKAAAGGDFTVLQRETYDELGITLSPPGVSLGNRVRQSIPQEHRKIFDLQAGQVSEPIPDSSGFYIYKVVSKQLIPLAQAKDQIRATLKSESVKTSAEGLFASVKPKFNHAYFGDPTPLAEDDPAANPDSAAESAGGQSGTTKSSGPTAQTSSLDKEWADSSVRSVLLQKGVGPFVPPPESVVPQNAPVITIDGLCDRKPPSAADCQAIVTRAEFETMQNAENPGAVTNDLIRWANQYADWLVHGEKARQLGLEDNEQYKFAMSFMAMDSRFSLLNNLILDRSKQLTDADLAEFYRENPRLFEEIKTVRIVVPQFEAFPADKGKPTPEQIAAGHAEMRKEAENIAARAALPNADFQALENEGWKASHYIEEPPDVAQPPVLRWEIWPRTRIFIFDLKVGEVSSLIDEPRNGFYVYKILAKREVPFEEARAYIRKRYAGERYLDVVGKLLGTIKFSVNDEYFVRATPQPAQGEPGQQPSKEDTKVPSLDIKVPKKIDL